jgi:dTDP-4-dehydrorhamnose reductase
MRTIVITGSNGLLGQKLVNLFIKDPDIKLIATSKEENRINSKKGYIYESLDITKPGDIENLTTKYYPDSIIHTAALTNADFCEINQDECRRTNIDAVENIVKAANHIYAQLVLLSSDFVFNGKKGKYKENDDTDPVNYYGWSKRESEKIVEEKAVRWAIVRTSLVYGIYDNPGRTNLPLRIKDNLEKNKIIRVNNDQYRTPTLAEDLAAGISEIVQRDSEGYYNISGSEYMSILDLAYNVADFFGLDKSLILPVSSIDLHEKAQRPLKAGLNIELASRYLNYSPRKLVEGLKIIEGQLIPHPH